MLTAIIIEDEKKSRELLSQLLSEHLPMKVFVAGLAENIDQGIELLKKHKPDLIFLDVELAGDTGFDFLERAKDFNFDVIFTTAFDRYAIKAFKYSALDYLLKPIDHEDLKAAVNKLNKRQPDFNSGNLKFLLDNIGKKDEYQQKITLPTGTAFEVVSLKDIIRCEAEGNYTTFVTTDKRRILVSNGMKFYEDILPAVHFIRIHHHHLININHVVRFLKTDGGYAVMSDGSRVEISRRKKDMFLQRLSEI